MEDTASAAPAWKRLPHEEMDVYKLAVAFATRMELGAQRFARRPDLLDQIRRASTSVMLNLSEGAADFRPRERARFFRMARRSAWECLAILELARSMRLITEGTCADGQTECRRLSAMLLAFIRSTDRT